MSSFFFLRRPLYALSAPQPTTHFKKAVSRWTSELGEDVRRVETSSKIVQNPGLKLDFAMYKHSRPINHDRCIAVRCQHWHDIHPATIHVRHVRATVQTQVLGEGAEQVLIDQRERTSWNDRQVEYADHRP